MHYIPDMSDNVYKKNAFTINSSKIKRMYEWVVSSNHCTNVSTDTNSLVCYLLT